MMLKFSCVLLTLFTTILCSIVNGSGHANKLVPKASLKDVSNPDICSQEARCEPIQNYTCFGIVLPYSLTSLALADDSTSQLEIQDNLALWQSLRSVPRCWAVVQPLLCAVYMPKCENQTLSLPSQEMCRITRGPCQAVKTQQGWPSFLQCDNKKLFPPGCRNPLQEIKFNTTFKCVSPLVETDNPDNWYRDVEGCGLQCQNPLFSKEEHDKIQHFIIVMAFMCFFANLFTVFTFLVSWKVSSRYPAVIIFYINACMLVSSCGWLIQVVPGAKEKIVCHDDGTTRRRSGELLCIVTFILIYPFLMAALVWFVILAYAWYILFRQSGISEGIGKKKVSYFHITALCIPLVLTTMVLAMTEVDGDSVSGICFLASTDPIIRVGFLLLPVTFSAVIGGFFLIGGIYALVKMKLNSQELANEQVKKQIRHMILRIGIFSVFSLVFVLTTFVCHAYDFMHRKEWEDYLREYIVCSATSSVTRASCTLKNHPNISVVHLHHLALFGFGIVMSSWAWTRATIESWRRFFYRCCGPGEKDALVMKKHQLIAKAFQHRQNINQGRFSFSLNSTQEDPIGMNLDVNSVASRELSSSWAAALPQFLNRRNAVATVGPLGRPQYSSASDVSIRRISLDSYHQQNLDSLSQQMSEQEYALVLRQQRRKTRKERERFLRANRIAPWFPRSRRGSDTSMQSSIIAASVAAAVANASNGKVTKSTSTGDLNNIVEALFPRPVSSVVNRPFTQRQVVPNLPFTHGMNDGDSHYLTARRRQKPFENEMLRGAQGWNPTIQSSASQSPLAALYQQNYGYMPQVPFGYLPSTMCHGLLPGYLQLMAASSNCATYNPLNYFPYGQFTVPNSVEDQCHTPLIPLHPTADSSSEAEFLPIVLSDSEFTDGGHHSYDEAQLLSAQRLLQEHVLQSAVNNNSDRTQPRPTLEPQSCAKTQFLKKIESAAPLLTQKYNADEKIGHSEAPPPSPVDSEQEELTEENCANGKGKLPKTSSRQSLKSVGEAFLSKVGESIVGCAVSENFFQRVKTKIKRAASFSHTTADADSLELNLKSSRTSLRHAPNCKTDIHHKETTISLLKQPEPSTNNKKTKSQRTGSSRNAVENISR